MFDIGVISYGTGALCFLILALVLMTGRRGRPQKTLLLYTCLASAAWLGITAYSLHAGNQLLLSYLLEPLRDLVLIVFLARIITNAACQKTTVARRHFRKIVTIGAAYSLLLMSLVFYRDTSGDHTAIIAGIDLLLAGFMTMAVVGLVLVEQLYRNTRPESRRACKYLCLGMGGLFAYDFYLYSNALLFQGVSGALWEARGFVNALVVPVLGIAVARDTRWSLDIFVSRRMVFHTTALLGTGLYLLAMGVGGYYIRVHGGSWGGIAQATFLFGSALILLILLFSGQLRARLRVLINKHFFHYKYDYRDEWLRFIRTLSSGEEDNRVQERAIRSIAEILESHGGIMWLRNESGRFEPVAGWRMDLDRVQSVAANHSLIRYMEAREWLIDIDEYVLEPDLYTNLALPGWLTRVQRAWLIVPLLVRDHLIGFIVLDHSPVRHHFNWEDSDLIKTVARQVAVHLSQLESSRALAEAQQFEACNRLSAYVMHDLKNLIAQLSLVVTNAGRHKHNPRFMDDVITTVDNSVTRMNRLLAHLHSDSHAVRHEEAVDLCPMLHEVVETMSSGLPVPHLDCQARDLNVYSNRERLAAVVGHLIRNAQDATHDEGAVIVRLFKGGSSAIIEVQDNGSGMDEAFVRDRLFKPFDTTKGDEGMGIGVYETREFIRSAGGDVEVISRPGEGTSFRIRLPISTMYENTVKSATA